MAKGLPFHPGEALNPFPQFAASETSRKLVELTFAKTSGTATGDKEKNWPIRSLSSDVFKRLTSTGSGPFCTLEP